MSNRLKVLFTTNIPVPYRIDFFNELGRWVDLTVAFERRNAKSRDSSWLNQKIINFKAIFMNGKAIGDDIAFCPEILRIVRKGKFDRIVVGIYYSPTGILLTQYLRFTHTPFLMTGDGGFPKKENRVKHWIKSYLNHGASRYLITSAASKKGLSAYGIPQEKMKVYPFTSLRSTDILNMPVNEEKKENIRHSLGIKEKKMVLGVGRLLLWKGWQDLIAISKQLGSNCGIYVVGGQPQGTEFEPHVNQTSSNFHFIDFKQKADLLKWYQAADVFVLPSRNDIWGLVVNEAMAMGLPIVTTYTTVAGLELIQEGVNGYLYHAGDTGQLLNILNRILNNKALRHSMSKVNLEKIRNYTIENMAKVCHELITES